jgi:hypothetical protein
MMPQNRRKVEQSGGEEAREKLKVLQASLMASRDMAESLDGDCPQKPEVLALISKAIGAVGPLPYLALALVSLLATLAATLDLT